MRPRQFWQSAALVGLLLFTAGCEGLRLPRLVWDTPVPTPGPTGPTATPLPQGIVNFTVHVPANTPPGTAPAVKLIDEVGGSSITVILTSTGSNVWTGSTPSVVGAVLRYRFVRPLPAYVEELTATRQPVQYRLVVVSGPTVNIEDTVAAWSDTPFAGDTGALSGTVKNSNTGQGVSGIIVSAGGQLTLTAWDGSYAFFDLPVGVQRATILAPDGSLRPTQANATVAKGQTVSVDLASPDPNEVHVTFIVSRPPNLEAIAPMRMAGDVLQLGDTFVPDAGGSAIAAAREPVMAPLADGRWTTSLLLYEGTVLRYKYTLGDGVWNGELDSTGAPRLRTFIVPLNDVTVEESTDAWHTGLSSQVTFELTTPGNTPANDFITMQFRTDHWRAPAPMWRTGVNQWKFILYNPTDFSGNLFYRYCRNFACGTADDASTAGTGASGHFFTPTVLAQDLKDNVSNWQWLADTVPASTVLPNVTAHPNFAAGVAFTEEWNANWAPFYAETFTNVRNLGSNWVTFIRRGSALQMNSTPAYADDYTLAPLALDWKNLAAQAHAAGLRVALHPVTCHYTPYGACDYWSGAPFGVDFWNKWFAAYEKFIVTQADLAARSGVDLLVVGDFKLRPSFPGEPEAPADAEARWRTLIANVRKHYTGSIAFELLMGQSVWPSPPKFLDAVDTIRFFWWSSLASSATPSVADLATSAGGLMDTQLFPIQQQFKKPMDIVAAYYSVDGAATQCLKRGDGQCYSFEDFNPGGPDVSQYSLDLQEQADIYNGLLNAVNGRTWLTGFSAYGYNPVVTLRDKSISVRGKPAEAVLAAWYPKLQGR